MSAPAVQVKALGILVGVIVASAVLAGCAPYPAERPYPGYVRPNYYYYYGEPMERTHPVIVPHHRADHGRDRDYDRDRDRRDHYRTDHTRDRGRPGSDQDRDHSGQRTRDHDRNRLGGGGSQGGGSPSPGVDFQDMGR